MRIGILARGDASYSTKRLLEAARARGHRVEVLDPLRVALLVARGASSVRYRGAAAGEMAALLPRIGASLTLVGTAIVRQFEQRGTYVVNGSHPILVARDKLRALQVLSRADVPIPETVFARGAEDVVSLVREIGGAPVILKLLEGTQGVGVMLADTENVAQAILETFESLKQNVIVQRFVRESRGRDVRAFIVGGKVVAAMRRTAQGDEFRSNVHRGGSTEAVVLDDEQTRVATRAANVLGLEVAGVDMLEGTHGPLVMEVNSSPGLEGIEEATGIDVASAIIRHIESRVERARRPLRIVSIVEPDLVVAEATIDASHPELGKTLRETALEENGVRVLAIRRDARTLSLPRADERLASGDVLVCFGVRARIEAALA